MATSHLALSGVLLNVNASNSNYSLTITGSCDISYFNGLGGIKLYVSVLDDIIIRLDGKVIYGSVVIAHINNLLSEYLINFVKPGVKEITCSLNDVEDNNSDGFGKLFYGFN